MRLRPILTPTVLRTALAAAACLVFAGPVAAQQAQPASDGQALGLRYLSWAGKTDRVAPATATPAASNGRRPAAIIPRRTAAPADALPPPAYARETRYGPAPSNGLTPASAWLSPAPRAPAPPPAPLPAPAYVAAAEPAPSPAYRPASLPAPRPMPSAPAVAAPPPPYAAAPPPVAPAPTVVDPMAPRRDAPIFRMRAATPPPAPAAPAPQSPEAPPPAVEPQAADPMAPRRDAPIFRMQSAAPSPAAAPQQAPPPAAYATADQPGRDSARYYSVHRAAGRQPDATALPDSVYLDHVPLNLTDTPTSTDLAEPPATPAVTRTINGRAQVITPNEDPSLP